MCIKLKLQNYLYRKIKRRNVYTVFYKRTMHAFFNRNLKIFKLVKIFNAGQHKVIKMLLYTIACALKFYIYTMDQNITA